LIFEGGKDSAEKKIWRERADKKDMAGEKDPGAANSTTKLNATPA